MNDPINPDIHKNDTLSGFTVIRIEELPDINAVFYELHHKRTGAKYIHISTKDTENTFSVALKTVPADSTGVAHILEHTALCGSEKYPVRDPFFSMIKRSLNTFMNAFTSSDWTMYPFSTQNRKDFYNLMDVYLDAVFFPKLDELSFKQEGHRLETDNDELVYKGVVYNEMKGAMSSPSQIMGRSILNALYPTTTYGWNSGGDPKVIPDLTWQQLVDFHKSHYHPSNAYFYTYGNIPLKDHLEFISTRVLDSFDHIDPKTTVPNEPRWESPKSVRYYYPLDKRDPTEKKCQICLGWLTADITDSFEILTLSLLSHILIGNSASPLRKALIDSKLGSALCDASGFDSDNRDTMFAIGLKDVNEEDAGQIESIILTTLKDLAENGVDQELIDSAIHQTEFRRKEITNTPYPYGIKLLLGLSGSWFHNGDSLKSLRVNDDLDKLRTLLSEGPFFEEKIREYFLQNTHRVTFTLAPDQEMEENESIRVKQELKEKKASLTESQLNKINCDAKELESLQESDEDLSCLPTLKITDIPPDVMTVNPSEGYDNHPALCYSQATSGIIYFVSAGGLAQVPESLLPLVPFFCSAFTRMGTGKRDYSGLARLISATTGGVGLSVNSRTSFDGSGVCTPFVSFTGKCLNRNRDRLFDIINECSFEYDFSDTERLKSLLLEYRAGLDSAVVQNGHALAMSRATKDFTETCRHNELWYGISQHQYIKSLTDALMNTNEEEILKSLIDNFNVLCESIFKPENFRIALIGEEDQLREAAGGTLSSFAGKVGNRSLDRLPGFKHSHPVSAKAIREGWSTNSAVSFVASAFRVVPMQHPDAPALAVLSKLFRSKFIHREIREKGGAYGGFSIYNSEDGIFCFGSYRDPHVVKTLKVFEEAGDYIRKETITDDDIAEAILQVCSAIDRPDPPGPAARKAFFRKMIALSDDDRSLYKKRILDVSQHDIKSVAETYFSKKNDTMSVTVISGEDKLKASNETLGGNYFDMNRI